MSYNYNDREEMFIQFAANPPGVTSNSYWNRINYFQEGCTSSSFSAVPNGSGYVFANFAGDPISADRNSILNFAIAADYSLAHSQPSAIKQTYCVKKPAGLSNYGSMISFTQFNGNKVRLTPSSNANTDSYDGGSSDIAKANRKGIGFYT